MCVHFAYAHIYVWKSHWVRINKVEPHWLRCQADVSPSTWQWKGQKALRFALECVNRHDIDHRDTPLPLDMHQTNRKAHKGSAEHFNASQCCSAFLLSHKQLDKLIGTGAVVLATPPHPNTHPPTAGMMLLATIGVGVNIKALWLWWWCDCMCEGITRLGEWGIAPEHRFVRQRMLHA